MVIEIYDWACAVPAAVAVAVVAFIRFKRK